MTESVEAVADRNLNDQIEKSRRGGKKNKNKNRSAAKKSKLNAAKLRESPSLDIETAPRYLLTPSPVLDEAEDLVSERSSIVDSGLCTVSTTACELAELASPSSAKMLTNAVQTEKLAVDSVVAEPCVNWMKEDAGTAKGSWIMDLFDNVWTLLNSLILFILVKTPESFKNTISSFITNHRDVLYVETFFIYFLNYPSDFFLN
jgi:hypothetical protein